MGIDDDQSAAPRPPAHDLAMFVKSYMPDAPLVARLVKSVAKYNVDGIPLVLAVPDDEVAAFARLLDYRELMIVPESQLGAPIVTEKVHNFTVGYIQQQLVKLCVHRLGLAEQYFVLDSDSLFIRPFGHADFLDGSGLGLTVLVQDKDQLVDPGYARFATLRMPMVNTIADYFSLPPQPRATSHNNTVLSSEVLSAFERWREEAGLSLVDLMQISPLEYSWYNFYLQKYHPELVIPIEPLIRMIHTRSEFRSLVRQGITIAQLRESYIGVCINSGWAGRDQARVVAKLLRGSPLARARVRRDKLTYAAHQRIEFFRMDRVSRSGGEPR